MNISSGISEITLNRPSANRPASNKVYIWPDYAKGKVEKVRRIEGQGTRPIYFKPSPEEQERILGQIKNRESSYGSDGRSSTQGPALKPGSLFDAIA